MSEHQNAFEMIKEQLCLAPMLQYFDIAKPVVVQTNESKNGFEAAYFWRISQCHASRSLSESEQNYGQIEKELFIVLCAMRKFHQPVFGKIVLLQTDHKT